MALEGGECRYQTLRIGLTTPRDVDAGVVGRLLIDAQKDYRRLYGQSLVLVGLRRGRYG